MRIENLPFPIAILFIPVMIALLGPLIDMGPLSSIQIFYEASLVRNINNLESSLKKKGYEK